MRRVLAAAGLALLTACGTEPRQPDPLKASLAQIDAAAGRLAAIDSAMRAIQRRDLLEFAVPVHEATGPMLPSDVWARSREVPASAVAPLMAELLRRAAARETLPRRIESAACRDRDAEVERGVSIPAADLVAKSLDTAVRIAYVPCPTRGIAINSPAASRPTDTNFPAMASEAARRDQEAANEPFRVAVKDRAAVMLGQAYRYGSTNDDSVGLPAYIQTRTAAALREVESLLAPYATALTNVTVVYDRLRTRSGADLLGNRPQGWFAALADPVRREVYISPTLVRATFVACAAELRHDVTVLKRLSEIRPQLVRGYHTPSDVEGLVKGATARAEAFDRCMTRQAAFLLGHELAHASLGIADEARADCVGRAVARALGERTAGVFEPLIFGLAGTPDAAVLGFTDKADEDRLACRARLHRAASDVPPLDSAIPQCRALQETCQ